MRLGDLTIFVLAADSGSLSAAARALDITPAVASAAIKRLEDELGTRLLARSTRSLRLTRQGEQYLEHARAALASLQAGRDTLARDQQQIGGKLTLAMPSDLGRNLLAPWLDEFLREHPALSLHIRLSDHLTDLYRQPVDLAIRYGQPEDSSLIALPLAADNRRVLTATPDYLRHHGQPRHPDDLARHNCLRYALSDLTHDQWTFWRDGQSTSVRVAGDRIADDGDMVRRWALAGLGLAYKSQLDVLADLRAGRLQTVLGDWQGEPAPIYLLCAHRQMLSPAIDRLRRFLQQRIADYLAGD
ncbi:MAG: LysR family transcriptional regulator [Paludibacterium sp.]|uniref:LysR family transcriptional regulator n=1 Tax=Paludibacterium sp. TaxID=1917523 RepID=UPI0025CEBE71|nr:LysR family transcriptional regulator [Paludibacterium sp.]MBV8049238.1 LysR family transcriptional regulator [Paludibacterium sp.]MBV8646682.1 LysR family transcriptional regulator [Paludibacterium sp.]